MARKTRSTLIDKDSLFKGEKASDYDYFKKAVPHHDRFQRAIADAVDERINFLHIYHQNRKLTDTVFIDPKEVPPSYDNEEMISNLDRIIGQKKKLSLQMAELGVGSGVTLGFVARKRRYLTGVDTLYAVDLSKAMIDITASRFSGRKLKLVTDDICSFLSTKTNKLHLCYSAYTIHNLSREQQVEIFHAISKSLVVGGYFVYGDLFAYENSIKQTKIFEWQLNMFKRHLPSQLSDEWTSHYTSDRNNYLTFENAALILQACGFATEPRYREKLEGIIVAKKIR